MLRTLPLLLALVSFAPLQCSKSKDASLRREDTAGDALYALAQDFRAKGKDQSYRDTLRFLIARYPSSRYSPAAREELGEGSDGGTEVPATK